MKNKFTLTVLTLIGLNTTISLTTSESQAATTDHFRMSDYDNKCNFSPSVYKAFSKSGVEADAINSFENHPKVKCSTLRQKDVILVDFMMSLHEDRFFVLSYSGKKVKFAGMVSHAFNTGDDYAYDFSNVPNSNYSVKGLFKTHNRVVRSIPPYSYPLSGLDTENSNTFRRNITIHRSVFDDNDYVGHSYGCFALTPDGIKKIKEFNIEGTYLYAYHEE